LQLVIKKILTIILPPLTAISPSSSDVSTKGKAPVEIERRERKERKEKKEGGGERERQERMMEGEKEGKSLPAPSKYL